MTQLLLLARLLLCVVFLVAGLAKLADLAGSRQAMRDFGVPGKLADMLGLLLPVAELAIAIALVVPITAWWGAIGALRDRLLTLARGFTPGARFDNVIACWTGRIATR